MKKQEVCLIALVFALLLLPSTLMAQTTPPPRCCPIQGDSAGFLVEDGPLPSLKSEFVVSDAMLALQGITRSQFVDRLSESLFPGEAVDLVLSSIEPLLSGDKYFVGQSLVNGQEYYFYRIPRYALSSEQLDMLDQVGITDGVTYVEVTFVENVLTATN